MTLREIKRVFSKVQGPIMSPKSRDLFKISRFCLEKYYFNGKDQGLYRKSDLKMVGVESPVRI